MGQKKHMYIHIYKHRGYRCSRNLKVRKYCTSKSVNMYENRVIAGALLALSHRKAIYTHFVGQPSSKLHNHSIYNVFNEYNKKTRM